MKSPQFRNEINIPFRMTDFNAEKGPGYIDNTCREMVL